MEKRKSPLFTATTENRTFSFTSKQLLVVALLLLVIISTLFIWRTVEIEQVRNEFASKEIELKSQAKRMQMEAVSRQLKLLAKPYSWAVRAAMLQSNLALVNEYANDIVTEKNVVSVMLVDANNIVISSTNKKYQGQGYLRFGNKMYLNGDSATVNNVNDSTLVLTSPVMSFNNRLGTIILTYTMTPWPLSLIANP